MASTPKAKPAAAGGEVLVYNKGTFRNSALVRQQTLAAYQIGRAHV